MTGLNYRIKGKRLSGKPNPMIGSDCIRKKKNNLLIAYLFLIIDNLPYRLLVSVDLLGRIKICASQ